MLLRELVIEEYVLSLNQNEDLYEVEVTSENGEKVFLHEYQDYEELRETLDIIVSEYESSGITISKVLEILEDSKQ